jgi:cytochrome b
MPVRVWDLPTRLFHWLIVVCVAFSWWSAENHHMDWHYKSGLVALGLILFRLIWGVIGGSTARFASFVRGPGTVLSYVRNPKVAPERGGHNPLGGWSVIALLLALVAQVATGLVATDVDGLESGPLSYLVSFDQGRAAAEIHELAFNAMLALIALHVVAIVVYAIRGRRLVGPMVTGSDTQVDPAAPLRPAGRVAFVVAAVLAAGLAWFIANGLSFTPPAY